MNLNVRFENNDVFFLLTINSVLELLMCKILIFYNGKLINGMILNFAANVFFFQYKLVLNK